MPARPRDKCHWHPSLKCGLLISAACLALVGCRQSESGEPTPIANPAAKTQSAKSNEVKAPVLAQGIRGRVERIVGAYLAEIDEEPQAKIPLAVPVHIFRGRLQPFDKPDPSHPALVKIVPANAKGEFELPLPAGEYTVVADLSGRLYLNNQMEDGSWATTTVQPNQWRNYTIEDVNSADP